MKIACLCPTYKRPGCLNEAVECFLRQDYPAELRELVILDDAAQYAGPQPYLPGVRLISTDRRCPTLGDKRNETIRLASLNCDAFAVWDDDDIYLPHHLSSIAAALQGGADYCIPSVIWLDKVGGFVPKVTGSMFHGAWGFTRAIAERVGGYPSMHSGQDQGFLRRMRAAKAVRADSLDRRRGPSYAYRWYTAGHKKHFSALGPNGHDLLGKLPAPPATLAPGWGRNFIQCAHGLEWAHVLEQ